MIEILRERWEGFTLIRMRLGKDASGEIKIEMEKVRGGREKGYFRFWEKNKDLMVGVWRCNPICTQK